MLGEEGRRFFEDYSLFLEDPVFAPEPRQLLELGRRQASLPFRAIGASAVGGQRELAGQRAIAVRLTCLRFYPGVYSHPQYIRRTGRSKGVCIG